MWQQTIKRKVEVTGVGLHSGEAIKMVLEPARENSGITFFHAKTNQEIPLKVENISQTKLATTLGKAPSSIATIEHFLSALYAYGIDNLQVTIFGDEVPIMDGSAIAFCMLLDEAGIKKQNAPKKVMVIKNEIKVQDGLKYAKLKPASKPKFTFTINFDHPVIGKEYFSFTFTKQNYLNEIARARTFGFAKDIQYLQSINLALGASLENAIGLDETSVLNPEGLRFEDEFVRHKILDAMGDLMVLGMPILGEYEAYASSHQLNHLLTKELLQSNAYEIVSLAHSPVKAKELAIVYA